MIKNTYPTEMHMNSIQNLLTGLHKNIQVYYRLWLEIAEGTFHIGFLQFFNELMM